MSRDLGVAWLGRRDYEEASRFQEALVESRRLGEIEDVLLMLEHPPTYTCGRRTKPEDLPKSSDWYEERGITVCNTPRGGQVTYHGPGQLVIYPIIDLRGLGEQPSGAGKVDVAGFVADLEEAMVKTTNHYLNPSPAGKEPSGSEKRVDSDKNRPGKVVAGVLPGSRFTGVWVGKSDYFTDPPTPPEEITSGVLAGELAKAGSIGLRISRGVSSHGLSLNVSCDLAAFSSITACGIEGSRATSILEIYGRSPDVQEVGDRVSADLASLFGRELTELDPKAIGIAPVVTASA